MKEPGYTYDLFYIFIHYFNREYILDNFSNRGKYAEDVLFSDEMLKEFPNIPEELRLFFHIGDNPVTFISEFYYKPYRNEWLNGTYNLSFVLNGLTNHDQVVLNVLRHYFRNEPLETLQKCKDSLPAANALIKNSSLDTRLKNDLYSFLIDPVPVIQLLSRELKEKDLLLSRQYEKKAALLQELKDTFDYPVFVEKIKQDARHSTDWDTFDQAVVSFCYYHKNHLCLYFLEDTVMIVMGHDYADSLDYLIHRKFTPKLTEFGTAISEPNRAAILQLLHEKGEASMKEIEHALHLAGTNAYYHLNLMIRAEMIKTRHSGKKMIYSINYSYFHALIEVLKEYCGDNPKKL